MAKKKEETKELKVELNYKQNYSFLFNDNVPVKELKGKEEIITGELAEIFIKKGYGSLC